MATNSNLNNFLDKLKNVTDALHPVFVPSHKRMIMFKAMTTGQQKTLIKSVLDKELMGVTFNQALNKIILENCADPVAITVADRVAIAVQLRCISLGTDVTIDKNRFSIAKLAEDISKGVKSLDISTHEFTVGDVKINTVNPNLHIDNQGLDHLVKTLKNDVADKTKAGSMFSSMLTVEISKFIGVVEVGTDGEAVIDFKLLTVPQRVSVVDSLPSGIVKKVLESNLELKKQEDIYTTTDEGNQFTVDSAFFTVVNE